MEGGFEDRKGDANKISAALSARLEELKQRKHRIVDAFVQEHTIDLRTYQEQVDRLMQIALTKSRGAGCLDPSLLAKQLVLT